MSQKANETDKVMQELELRPADESAVKRLQEIAAGDFERLSWTSEGDSRGWKFNRDELHERL